MGEHEKTALSDGSIGFVPFGDNWYSCLTQGLNLTFGQGTRSGYLPAESGSGGWISAEAFSVCLKNEQANFSALHYAEPLLLTQKIWFSCHVALATQKAHHLMDYLRGSH